MRGDDLPSMSDLDDEQLLALAAGRDVASGRLRAAQAELYRRHVRYLYGALKKREGMLSRTVGLAVEDLVQETFQRAFQYGASYKALPQADAERARLRTRAWLGRIAQNLIIDALSRSTEISASPMLEEVGVDEADEPPPSSPELRAVRCSLEELSEREQDVLRVTLLYQRVGTAHQRLPNEVSAELARRWDTTNENIRAIRSRAMKKLMSHIDAARRAAGTP